MCDFGFWLVGRYQPKYEQIIIMWLAWILTADNSYLEKKVRFCVAFTLRPVLDGFVDETESQNDQYPCFIWDKACLSNSFFPRYLFSVLSPVPFEDGSILPPLPSSSTRPLNATSPHTLSPANGTSSPTGESDACQPLHIVCMQCTALPCLH